MWRHRYTHKSHMSRTLLIFFACLNLLSAADSASRQMAREYLKELIEIDTTDAHGDVTRAANAAAQRLRDAGFPASDVTVIGSAPNRANVIARLHGTGKGRPVLFLAHLDVVEARRTDWSTDPFKLVERDGYFYGRGTTDDKGGAALFAAAFAQLKRENYRPQRDLILALTAGEESGDGNGVEWLLANRRALIDAEYCINADAGGGQSKDGKKIAYTIQASEKGYITFRMTAKNSGGHSSLPVRDNAIYVLADALAQIRDVQFPVFLNPVSRTYFERMSATETAQRASDMLAVLRDPPDPAASKRLSSVPYFNAQLRTTCVATQLSGGHAENALPQSAEAIVNCRLLPGESTARVLDVLRKSVSAYPVELTFLRKQRGNSASASPWPPVFITQVEKIASTLWPRLPVTPEMDTGGTDGKPLRLAGIPTYGMLPFFLDVDDNRMHGKDERIGVESFYEGLDFNLLLIKALAER